MATFSTDKRKVLAQKGQAMPDGSFPIRNGSDLQNAIKSFGRANNKTAVKTWIIKRAKELNLETMLPDEWKSIKNSSLYDDDNYLEHHGILGMHWGHHKSTGGDQNYNFKNNYSKYKQKLMSKATKHSKKKGTTVEKELKIEVGKKIASDTLKTIGVLSLSALALKFNKKYGLKG